MKFILEWAFGFLRKCSWNFHLRSILIAFICIYGISNLLSLVMKFLVLQMPTNLGIKKNKYWWGEKHLGLQKLNFVADLIFKSEARVHLWITNASQRSSANFGLPRLKVFESIFGSLTWNKSRLNSINRISRKYYSKNFLLLSKMMNW